MVSWFWLLNLNSFTFFLVKSSLVLRHMNLTNVRRFCVDVKLSPFRHRIVDIDALIPRRSAVKKKKAQDIVDKEISWQYAVFKWTQRLGWTETNFSFASFFSLSSSGNKRFTWLKSRKPLRWLKRCIHRNFLYSEPCILICANQRYFCGSRQKKNGQNETSGTLNNFHSTWALQYRWMIPNRHLPLSLSPTVMH